MNESKAKKNTFKFVNYTKPVDARNDKVRRQVRSHVSKWQHSQSRARLFDAIRPNNPDAVSDINKEAELPYRTSRSSTPSSRIGRCRDSLFSPMVVTSNLQQQIPYARDDHDLQNTDDLDTEMTLFSPEACKLASSGLTKSFSQGAMSFRTIALQDSHNIIGISLNEMQLDMSSVMGLYKDICEVQSIDFSRQYVIGGEESSWGRFYSFVFTDPILLSTAVLLGVRNQLDLLGRCIDGQTFASVLGIERFLMRSINDALGDPVRGVSDPMLVAVALCAAYEIKHGSGACYHIHMQGLVQMIGLRGGLVSIGYPDPYIVRLLVWMDTNTSRIAGCRPYLQGMVNGLTAHPHANTTIFRAKGLSH